MIGKRPANYSLFDVGNVWPLEMKPKSFHYQLAVAAQKGHFKDEEFAPLYHSSNGRPSVPPSQLALMLILQTHDGVSDERAIECSMFDLRWAAVLGRHAGEALCAKSTLQLFRSHLILHEEFRTLLKRSIEQAKASGLIEGKAITAAIDTKPMLGRGAVQDTYNLLAQAMRQLARALARDAGCAIRDFLDGNGLTDLSEPSIKGTVVVDWNDEEQRDAFLSTLVEQARRLLKIADGGSKRVVESAGLLSQLLLQDVEEKSDPNDPGKTKASIKQETVRDRVPSATDPEQRHGRKSASKRFNGHKSSVVCETGSGIVLSCAILCGNAGDATDALKQVEEAQKNVGLPIGELLGDCAYGGAETRSEFADSKHTLFAKVPSPPSGLFGKNEFQIDLNNDRVTCPAGHISNDYTKHKDGGKTFYFDEHCEGCPLREQCTTSVHGRTLKIHPNALCVYNK
ncbi:MAG: transposase [Capsulimonas sp.]|uniref:transposase n=1 Tax=Capsulimonas sp. TaxID=2494211 RepID=UPI003263A51D